MTSTEAMTNTSKTISMTTYTKTSSISDTSINTMPSSSTSEKVLTVTPEVATPTEGSASIYHRKECRMSKLCRYILRLLENDS